MKQWCPSLVCHCKGYCLITVDSLYCTYNRRGLRPICHSVSSVMCHCMSPYIGTYSDSSCWGPVGIWGSRFPQFPECHSAAVTELHNIFQSTENVRLALTVSNAGVVPLDVEDPCGAFFENVVLVINVNYKEVAANTTQFWRRLSLTLLPKHRGPLPDVAPPHWSGRWSEECCCTPFRGTATRGKQGSLLLVSSGSTQKEEGSFFKYVLCTAVPIFSPLSNPLLFFFFYFL